MKRIAFVLFWVITVPNYCAGQFLDPPWAKTVFGKIAMPLLIIDSLETNNGSLIIQPENLKIVKEYDGPAGFAAFGEKGRNGVILAKTGNKTKLLRLPQVLHYFKIPVSDQKLRVMVDQVLINPDLFLADVDRIERLEVTKQDFSAPFRYSFNKDERYLNIVT